VVVKPAEHFDPEGLKGPRGEWRLAESLQRRRSARTTGRERGFRPVSASKTELSGGVAGRAGLCTETGVEAKVQAGSGDLGMAQNVVTGERKAVPSFRPRLDLDFEDRSGALTRWR